jgi:hypothetical protein
MYIVLHPTQLVDHVLGRKEMEDVVPLHLVMSFSV